MEENKIVINGIELDSKQSLMVKEAIYGHLSFGAQYEGYLEEEEGLSVDEQKNIIESIYITMNIQSLIKNKRKERLRMEKKKYTVELMIQAYEDIEVEASSLEEAYEKVQEVALGIMDKLDNLKFKELNGEPLSFEVEFNEI